MAEQVGFPHHFAPFSSEKRSGSGDSTPTLVESESVLGVPHPASLVHHLEAAQIRKLHHILTKARVKPGDRVLEFGTGWGGCAIEVRPAFFLWPLFSSIAPYVLPSEARAAFL